MKCCTLPGKRKNKTRKTRKGSLLGKAAKACKGKKKAAFKKCVKAKIKKLR